MVMVVRSSSPFLPKFYWCFFFGGGEARITRKGSMWLDDWLAIDGGGDLCEGRACWYRC